MKAAAALWLKAAVVAVGLTLEHADAYGHGLLPRSSLVKSGQHHHGHVLSHSAEATVRHRPLRMAAGGGGFFAKVKSGWKEKVESRPLDALVPDRARPGFGPSPSGINSKPNSVQAISVAAIALVLFAGVKGWIKVLESKFPAFSSGKTAWVPAFLGAFYVVAGIAHFPMMKDMCNMVPDRGAWGFWRLPGRPSFHVKWTGALEILAGGAMVAGWFGVGKSAMLMEKAAAVLFGLTVAVTPANVFMFTHGAQFPIGQDVSFPVHVARGAVQCLLLSALWKLAML